MALAHVARAVARPLVTRATFSSSACAFKDAVTDPPTGGDAPRPLAHRAPTSVGSSTSALDYKLRHHRSRPPALPAIDPPRWSAEEAVTNILYNTPPPSTQPFTRHVLNCLVQNEPGVLSRVSGILAARGFNIDSLVVCATEIQDLSRMCIVLRGQDGVIEQARRQLEDLVPVWAVLDYTRTRTIERELLLCKASILGPEYFEDQLASKIEDARTHDAAHQPAPHVGDLHHVEPGTPAALAAQATADAAAASHPGAEAQHHAQPAPLSPSEALRQKHLNMAAIEGLARNFGGKIVDVSHDCLVVEVSGKTARIDAFLKLIRPYGILEAARTGTMVMPRSQIKSSWRGMTDEEPTAEQEQVDAGLLPPG